MSHELKTFLHNRGCCTSRTTPYNPRGNRQTEKFNGTLWNAGQKQSLFIYIPTEHLQVSIDKMEDYYILFSFLFL